MAADGSNKDASRDHAPTITAVTSGQTPVHTRLNEYLKIRWAASMKPEVAGLYHAVPVGLLREAIFELEALDFDRTALRAERDELLEALKALLLCVNRFQNDFTSERVERAEAAISKAEGR